VERPEQVIATIHTVRVRVRGHIRMKITTNGTDVTSHDIFVPLAAIFPAVPPKGHGVRRAICRPRRCHRKATASGARSAAPPVPPKGHGVRRAIFRPGRARPPITPPLGWASVDPPAGQTTANHLYWALLAQPRAGSPWRGMRRAGRSPRRGSEIPAGRSVHGRQGWAEHVVGVDDGVPVALLGEEALPMCGILCVDGVP
jgi:hypothetical protein